jgi:hypothetical protein
MTSERLVLTDKDKAWADIAKILAEIKHKAGRPPAQSDRMFIEQAAPGATCRRSLASGMPCTIASGDGKDAAYGRDCGQDAKWMNVRSQEISLLTAPLSVPISMRLGR